MYIQDSCHLGLGTSMPRGDFSQKQNENRIKLKNFVTVQHSQLTNNCVVANVIIRLSSRAFWSSGKQAADNLSQNYCLYLFSNLGQFVHPSIKYRLTLLADMSVNSRSPYLLTVGPCVNPYVGLHSTDMAASVSTHTQLQVDMLADTWQVYRSTLSRYRECQ